MNNYVKSDILKLLVPLVIYLSVTLYFFLCNPFFDTAQTIAIILTGVVIIFYTYETFKLRKVSQRQTELLIRPFISIYKLGVDIGLQNIGRGSALNINIESPPFNHKGSEYRLIADDTIPLLNAGDKTHIKTRVNIGDLSKEDLIMFEGEEFKELEIELIVSYQDLELSEHRNRIKLKPYNGEILNIS